MPKIYRLIAMFALLVMVALISGCYTVVGTPPMEQEHISDSELEEGAIEEDEEVIERRVYTYYGDYHGRPYPYYWSYYDLYYSPWYNYSYRDYWYSPWNRYYGDRYYRDYDYKYIPQKKSETERRGASGPRRAPVPQRRNRSSAEENEEQQSRGTLNRQEPRERVQKPAQSSRDSSSAEKRSIRRQPKEDEDQ